MQAAKILTEKPSNSLVGPGTPVPAHNAAMTVGPIGRGRPTDARRQLRLSAAAVIALGVLSARPPVTEAVIPAAQSEAASSAAKSKSDGAIGSVIAAVIGGLVAAVGWFVAHELTTRREDRTERLQLSIAQSEKQIGEFYAPLIYLLEQLDMLAKIGDGLPEAKRSAIAKVMYEEYFLPTHEQIISILKSKIHLLEGAELPPNLRRYFRHYVSENLAWRASKEELDLWGVVEGFPEHFPAELKRHQERVYQRYEDALRELHHGRQTRWWGISQPRSHRATA